MATICRHCNARLQHKTATQNCNTLIQHKHILPDMITIRSSWQQYAVLHCNTILQPKTAIRYCNTRLQHTHILPEIITIHSGWQKSVGTATHDCNTLLQHTTATHDRKGWRRLRGCLKLQVIFRERATNYRALWRKVTYEDKASCDSTPPCSTRLQHTTYYCNTLHTTATHYKYCNT